MRTRILICLLVLMALLATGRTRAAAAPAPFEVLAFQTQGAAPELIGQSAPSLTAVGVAGITLSSPGTVSAVDPAALVQLARAHAAGRPAVLLVNNWSEAAGAFSAPLAHQTLVSGAASAQAAATVAGDVVAQGWDGVSVDLEQLRPRDRGGLRRFVADLRAALPAAATLSICLQPAGSPPAYASRGYDLRALAAAVDRVVLMTYDDHGPWENTPGPIGPVRWQRAEVRALERVVPRGRILLGAANYAYAWRPGGNEGLTVAEARALTAAAQAQPRWVAAAGEWTATLPDGSVLWWADARSVARRIALARALGLRGIAVWSLGTGDPIP